MNDDIIPVYYPAWVQAISVLGLPALTGVSLWLISRPLWEAGLEPTQILIGLAVGYYRAGGKNQFHPYEHAHGR